MAFRNIWGNKTRSGLTMLGIIIGIASVIMVLCVGGGGKKQFTEQLGQFSSGSVYLYVGGENATANDNFTDEDVAAIRALESVEAATMAGGASGTVRGTKEEAGANISSGNGDMFRVFPATVQRGRSWDAGDYEAARRVITIDSDGAKTIFGTDDVVGLTVQLTLNGRTSDFTIVGVTKSMNGSFFTGKVTANITMPQSTLIAMSDVFEGPYFQVAFLAKDTQNSETATNAVLRLMGQRHGNTGRDVYIVQDVNKMSAEINNVTSMFTNIIAAIAGISLLVGGIGVMNIMLVSVTERTREIGIRKALGAKTGSILFQFLVEAGTLTLVGGLIGIVLGIAGGYGVASLLGLQGSISPMLVVAIALFSTVIGIFFGIYPAKKAARLSPIEALRTE